MTKCPGPGASTPRASDLPAQSPGTAESKFSGVGPSGIFRWSPGRLRWPAWGDAAAGGSSTKRVGSRRPRPGLSQDPPGGNRKEAAPGVRHQAASHGQRSLPAKQGPLGPPPAPLLLRSERAARWQARATAAPPAGPASQRLRGASLPLRPRLEQLRSPCTRQDGFQDPATLRECPARWKSPT